ncbi:MAG: His-Xaa-Ser system protein HxsD [Anaerovorax sp.]
MTKQNKCVFTIDDRIFNKTAVFKAAFVYIDHYYIHLFYAEDHLLAIEMVAKSGSISNDIENEFCNQLLSQMLRYQIAKENKNIRELILGRALYSTCIDTALDEKCADNEFLTDNSMLPYTLDDIAVNWFEVEGNDN